MLSRLRGFVQPIVRAAVRAEMTVRETFWTLKEAALDVIYGEVEEDYGKFARQDYIAGEIPHLNQDQLIPGELHEESLWKLSQKYRYEVTTPWETITGELIPVHTVITSEVRLTPNEVFESAADHPSMYAPEAGVFRGEMQIEGVWVT